ncbi:MAG: redoxin domain-containing protein [Chloroflexi bacterium]|nr:redoxin domain-containing protein [Chloroflexota bacterium]
MTTSNPDSRRRRAPWRGALTVVAVLAALVAFACTGDDEPEPEPTTAPVTRSTPRPATATPPPPTLTPTPTATEGPRRDMPASSRSTPSPTPTPAATSTPTPSPTPPPATATPTPTPTPPTPTPTPEPPRVRPEIEVTGLGRWFNSEPFTIGEQVSRGNVVLIDFWTYSCINCVRTLPYLRDWHDKYAEHGLVILGVHRPEFEFEHSATNVAAAIERLEVTWPVAQDNDSRTWRAFNNRYWPAKYLFDTTGKIVHTRFGEGAYLKFEEEIRAALTRAGSDVSDIPLGQGDQARDPEDRRRQTRELYGGYWRIRGSYAAQDEYYLGTDREVEYVDIGDPSERVHDKWYVHGLWRNEREAIVHARETTNLEDYFALQFRARSVNVVLDPPPGQSYEVYITIDGRPLSADEAGSDVVFDADGNSLIRVTEPRHYAIVELPEFGEHDLRLASNSDHFGVFALTFGSYLEGP